MSITSLSFTFVNMYAPQSAKPAAPTERQAPEAPSEMKSCDEHRPAGRQNRLVEAMMSALRDLGFGSQATPASMASPVADASAAVASAQGNAAQMMTTDNTAAAAANATAVMATDTAAATMATDGVASADSAAAATKAAPTSEPAVTVESAVHQFAHELFRALRQIGRGESSEQVSGRIDGEGGHRHHHGHHGWGRQGYGDMAQRLESLSQTFAAPAAVAATSEVQPNSPLSTSISVTLTVQDGQADSPSQALTTATPAVETTAVAETAAAETAATPSGAQETAKNPLLDAFSKLFSALKPQSAGASSMDMSDKLRTFLHTLAQAMRPDSMSSIQTPQVGGLVNVTA